MILGCDFNSKQKGYIITWYYSTSIFIWNPQFSMHKPYLGCYTGHIHMIESCIILTSSPFCISIDERSILRVWDIRTFTTSQVVTLDSFEIPNPRVSVLSDDNLVLFSRKIFRLSNQNSVARKNILATVAPLHIAFNEYHKKFLVATRLDVRLYCSETGRLEDIFVDLVEQGSAIRCFEDGARNRMFYIGDTKGEVRLYNTKNGEHLKDVTDPTQDSVIIDRFMRNMHVKEEYTPFKDATALIYLHDEKILAVGTHTSQIKLYNEIDSEESQFSRMFLGGHLDSEISKFAYCRETEQLASGSDNGIVCVWNLSTGKLDNIFTDIQSRVTYLAFCYPEPYLLVVQKLGIVSIWGLKQGGLENSGKSILTLLNYRLSAGVMDGLETGLLIKSKTMLYKKNYYIEVHGAWNKSDIDTCKVIIKKHRPMTEEIDIENQFTIEDFEVMTSSFRQELSQQTSYSLDKSEDEANINKRCMYLILGTTTGSLIVLDLKSFFDARKVKSGPQIVKQNIAYQMAGRADQKSSESIAAHSQILNHLSHHSKKPTYKNLYLLPRSLIIQDHRNMTSDSLPLTMMHPIATSNHSLLTGSADSCISLFDRGFTELGSIDLLGNTSVKGWGFRFDWQADRKQRVNDVVRVENEIEGMIWSEGLVKSKTKEHVKEIEKINAANVGLAIVSMAYSVKYEFERLAREKSGIGEDGMIIGKKAYFEYTDKPEQDAKEMKNYKQRKTVMDKTLFEMVNKNVTKVEMMKERSARKAISKAALNESLMQMNNFSPRQGTISSINSIKPSIKTIFAVIPESNLAQNLSKKFSEIDDPRGKYKPPQRSVRINTKSYSNSNTKQKSSLNQTQINSSFRVKTHIGQLNTSRSVIKLNRTLQSRSDLAIDAMPSVLEINESDPSYDRLQSKMISMMKLAKKTISDNTANNVLDR